MPEFGTTTDTDKIVTSILFTGPMHRYFTHGFDFQCGHPTRDALSERLPIGY
ncbi:hypothetical protein BX600DRAFT_466587 [Xylariales sp. PMI_506]|nr:hypothetical protein BX600DRAFT_466587 [Xylariales sp. PMI_506]